ncbi:MAG TPA: cytochrome c oxidase subunit II [Candidatus Sulfotelmatobacter sp.]|nr:cytochrome c oxidase subunit II [Candidatus Sulfotelmatobacter sp.]
MPHRKNARTNRWLGALLVGATALIAGCNSRDYPQTSLTPRSDYAMAVQKLLEQQVMWVTIIFIVVLGLLLVAVFRFRSRPGAPDPTPVHGNTALEIAWTIAPAIILALVAVPTVMTIFKTQGPPPPGALTVKVVGHQWWWEFQYPEQGFVTGSEMHVPVHRPILVQLESADVIHSFWFPAMGGKRDVVPAHTNTMWFTPDTLGEFPGQCAELCGLSHANMHMKLFVETPEQFDAWVAHQKTGPVEPDSTTLAGQGKKIFLESACVSCHTINGLSQGVIGPNLTHFGSRTSIAGSMFTNTPDNLGHWIQAPDKEKPGTLMLNLGLAQDQILALEAYLESLK